MSQEQEKDGKARSDDLDQVLAQLTNDQIRFVVARQEHPTDKAAAEFIEFKPHTVTNWKREGAPIDEAVRLMAFDGLVTALHIRKRNLAKAMAVKVAGLDSNDARLRQSVSTEVIEWETGKAAQPTEHRGKVKVEQVSTDFSVLTDDELDSYLAICAKLHGRPPGEDPA